MDSCNLSGQRQGFRDNIMHESVFIAFRAGGSAEVLEWGDLCERRCNPL